MNIYQMIGLFIILSYFSVLTLKHLLNSRVKAVPPYKSYRIRK